MNSVDYGNIPTTYTIPGCQNTYCLNVTIFDDNIVETTETIQISGSVRDSRIRFSGGTAVITITDNDSMHFLYFTFISLKLIPHRCCSGSEDHISDCTGRCFCG